MLDSIGAAAAVVILPLVSASVKWVVWVCVSLVMTSTQMGFACYQFFRIGIDFLLVSCLKAAQWWVLALSFVLSGREVTMLWQKLAKARSLSEWSSHAQRLNDLSHADAWCETDEGLPTAPHLRAITQHLAKARARNEVRELMFVISGVLKRNHLGVDEAAFHTRCIGGTKVAIDDFRSEVCRCLRHIRNDQRQLSALEKLQFFQKASRAVGHTALCLSGGGAIAMYHTGVVRQLIELGLYSKIRVASGTSGGSIVAAMLACKTEEELLRDVLVPTVSTDFLRDGAQVRLGIRWFPPLWAQALNFVRRGVLIDKRDFERTTRFYYGEMTFQEAFSKTRKCVNITVTASRRGDGSGMKGPQRLLLNHINTPHVLISSAVAASCSLPGIMDPVKLMCKDSQGCIVPFEVDGVEWIDGSVQADVPFQRMSSLFNVSNFIVSQTNFHIVPFIHTKPSGTSPTMTFLISRLQKLFAMVENDIRYRALRLSKSGLMPRFFGHDVSKVFSQKYHGNVTIIPPLSFAQSVGLEAILNPDVPAMKRYLLGGMAGTWPHLNYIKHLIEVEHEISECMAHVRTKVRSKGVSLTRHGPLLDDLYISDDDGQSMGSDAPSPGSLSPVRTGSPKRRSHSGTASQGAAWSDHEVRRLRQRLKMAQEECEQLRDELQVLRTGEGLTTGLIEGVVNVSMGAGGLDEGDGSNFEVENVGGRQGSPLPTVYLSEPPPSSSVLPRVSSSASMSSTISSGTLV